MNTSMVVVALIIVRSKKLLMVRNFGKQVFYLPGGKIENGESDTTALKRELLEELHVEVDIHSLELFAEFQDVVVDEQEERPLTIRYYMGSFSGEVQKQAEIAEIRYSTFEEYRQKNNAIPVTLKLCQQLKDKGFID